MGSNIGKDQEQVSIVTEVVKEVAKVPVWAKLTPSTTEIVEEASAALQRRRRCDRVVEHVPVAAADRSGDARLRDERRWPGVERRPRRSGDPAAVAREDVAADQGVSRQGVLRHRRHQHVRARAQLHAARLRHGAGLHGGDARSRDRSERDQGPDRGHAAVHGEARLHSRSRTSAACGAATSSCTRRFAGPKARIPRRPRRRRLRRASQARPTVPATASRLGQAETSSS